MSAECINAMHVLGGRLGPLVLCASLLGGCALAGSRAALAPTPAEEHLASELLHTECFDDPIFAQRACVHRGGVAGAPVVLMVHGINGDGRSDWAEQIPVLVERYAVLAVDLPGFGASGRANAPYTVPHYAEFLNGVVERYAQDPVTVIGHSMGGAVALWFAYAYPQRVGDLILVDVAGVLHRMSLAKYAAGNWFASVFGGAGGGSSSRVQRLAGELLEEVDWLAHDPDSVLDSAANRERVLDGEPASIAAFALAHTDFGEVLNQVRAPALIIWGEADRVAPLRTAQVLARRLPEAELVRLDAGHSPQREVPTRFNEVLLAHLLRAETDRPDVPMSPARTMASVAGAQRVGSCEGQSGVVFEGDYERIEIRHCGEVIVRGVRTRAIDVFESTVEIVGSDIVGESVGLLSVGSEITVTATDIEADVAVQAERSRLDFAGVSLVGREAALVAPMPSSVIFSVTAVRSPYENGMLHAFRAIGKADRL